MARSGIFASLSRNPVLDAARTALAAVLSFWLAHLLRFPEYYWAPISTIVIIESTIPPLTLGWQRFVGTALGAALGAALATFFPISAILYFVGIFLCGIIAWLLNVGTAYRFAAIALSIVLLVPRLHNPWTIAWRRFLEVSLGIGVALVVTVIWPAAKKSA